MDGLIAAGANVNWQDLLGQTALHHAAATRGNRAEEERAACCAPSLMWAGAKPSLKMYCLEERTALHEAALKDLGEVLKAILQSSKCEVNVKDSKGRTPLHYAARSLMRCVELLLAQGASLNARDCHHRTPLYSACRSMRNKCIGEDIEGAFACVTQLLGAGTDVSKSRDSVGRCTLICDGITALSRTEHVNSARQSHHIKALLNSKNKKVLKLNSRSRCKKQFLYFLKTSKTLFRHTILKFLPMRILKNVCFFFPLFCLFGSLHLRPTTG